MKKHAYLIMAHNNFYILERLLCLIDDERNDIYIHVDKKVENFDFSYFKNLINKSRIYYINRMAVNWAGFSVTKCQMLLLKSAVENGYEYYHLISGVDLPLKTQDEIHSFFDVNAGKEFIGFVRVPNEKDQRVKYIYLFNEDIGRQTKFISKLKWIVSKSFVLVQKFVKYDRTRKFDYIIKHGANWYSITHSLAIYLINNNINIHNLFKYSINADEMVLQTIAFNSNFRKKIYYMNDEYAGCMRYIDWNRGTPYIFRKQDFGELISSDRLFARKFDENVDKEIVNMIYDYLNRNIYSGSAGD